MRIDGPTRTIGARWGLLLLAAFAAGSGGCGDSDAVVDVAGSYSVQLTTGSNTCGFTGWVENSTARDVKIELAQSGSAVTATFKNLLTSAWVGLVMGASALGGTVAGSHVHLELVGSREIAKDRCKYTIHAILEGDVSGDTINGTLRYRPQTNGNIDCGVLDSCENTQQFSGARPPAP